MNPVEPIEPDDRSHVDEAPILEDAREYRVGVRFECQRVEVDVPEEPAKLLGQRVIHVESIALSRSRSGRAL